MATGRVLYSFGGAKVNLQSLSPPIHSAKNHCGDYEQAEKDNPQKRYHPAFLVCFFPETVLNGTVTLSSSTLVFVAVTKAYCSSSSARGNCSSRRKTQDHFMLM